MPCCRFLSIFHYCGEQNEFVYCALRTCASACIQVLWYSSSLNTVATDCFHYCTFHVRQKITERENQGRGRQVSM